MASSPLSPPSKRPSEPQTPAPTIGPPPPSDQESQAPTAADAPPAPAAEPTAATGAGEADAEMDGAEGSEDKEEGEDEMECGFCLFMKGGGCKDAFVPWEKCVMDAETSGEDVADKCLEVTAALKKCMEAHPDYYEPILRAEQAMADAIAADGDDPDPEKKAKDS